MEYHKIQSLYKRDPATGNKRFLLDQYTLPEFELLKDIDWVGTEKIDGTNVRLYADGRIRGRTDNAQLHTGLMEVLGEISSRLKGLPLPESAVLYGEGYGEKIQNGGHYTQGQAFVLFDVNICGNWQPRETVEEIAAKLDLRVVPVLSTLTLPEWTSNIASGWYESSRLHEGARNEGVVLRPKTELRTRTGDRIITKLKFRDFK